MGGVAGDLSGIIHYRGVMSSSPTAFSYLRFSNPTQAAGDSRRRQTTAAAEYAAAHGLILDDTMRDEGVSAFRGRHREDGALGAFLAKIDADEIAPGSYLLIDSFDRLTRERVTRAIHLLTGIMTRGVVVVTLNDGRRYEDASAGLMELMYALMELSRSHEESREKGRKVGAARARERHRAREDLTPFTPVGPHWLRLEPLRDDAGRRAGGRWVKIPERVAVVQEIFDAKEEGLGYAAICRRLNSRGETTPRPRRDAEGRPTSIWTEATVGELIASRTVLGEYAPHVGHRRAGPRIPDGAPIAGFYPQIITPEQFDRVHTAIALRQNPNAKPRSSEFRNLLIGHVRCRCGGVVGYLASGRLRDGQRSAALRCPNVYRGTCDNRSRLNYGRVEAELLPFLAGLPATESSAPTDAAVALAVAETALIDLERRIGLLVDHLESGQDQRDKSESVGERLRQREGERAALVDRITILKAEAARERAIAAAPDWRARLAQIEAQMQAAEGSALYELRSRLNVLIGQAVPGGFTLDEGYLTARFSTTDPKGGKRKPLYYGAEGGLIRWEMTAGAPDFGQVRVAPGNLVAVQG